MMHLITGGSASGKSAYGEAQAADMSKSCGGNLIYIATMEPFGDEGRARVEKHWNQRQGKGFETVERYLDISDLRLETKMEGKPVVLLECMSNLIANELFEAGGTDEDILRRVTEGISCLQKQAEHLIIVTNEVFSDGMVYSEETMRYIRLLGQINRWLGNQADRVTEVVFGIPFPVKETETEMRKEGAEGEGALQQ